MSPIVSVTTVQSPMGALLNIDTPCATPPPIHMRKALVAGGTTTAAVANNTAARLETARVALWTMAVRTGEPLLGGYYLGPVTGPAFTTNYPGLLH